MTNQMTGWWLTYHSEKYESVGVTIPNIWKIKNVPNHQPDVCMHVCVCIYCMYIVIVERFYQTSKANKRKSRLRALNFIPQKPERSSLYNPY
jgi:hypothetical protein